MRLNDFRSLVETAVWDAVNELGETEDSIQVVIRDPDHYCTILDIASIEYRNGFVYIRAGNPNANL